jgi:hypothetical protein
MFSIFIFLNLLQFSLHVNSEQHENIYIRKVYLSVGQNIGKHVSDRFMQHLLKSGVEVMPYNDITSSNNNNTRLSDISRSTELIISIGNTKLSHVYNITNQLQTLPSESYIIESHISHINDAHIILSNGLPLGVHSHPNASLNKDIVHYGAVVGAYQLLEQLGYGFLHPLDPHIPTGLRLPSTNIRIVDSPRWPERSFHVHTQHPLELTEVLQGFDIPVSKYVIHQSSHIIVFVPIL